MGPSDLEKGVLDVLGAPREVRYAAHRGGSGPGYHPKNFAVGADAPAQPAQPLLSELAARLNVLSEVIHETNGTLAALGDRLLGSTPVGAPGGGNDALTPHPSGEVRSLLAIVEALLFVARNARDEAHRINGNI